jgi:hypothetical protein
MIDKFPTCSLHNYDQTPDRAGVRKQLSVLTKEVVNIITNTDMEGDPTQIEYPVAIGSYSDHINQHKPTFDRVMDLPAFANAKGRFTEYVTSNTSSRYDKPILTAPFIPIGEYGLGPASRLLIGTVKALEMAEIGDEKIKEIARQSDTSQQVILHHTFQGHINEDAETGLAIITQQGIISTAQSMALLTAERVQGEEWEDLVTNLVETDRITEFARRIGPGLLPYLVTFGRYIKNPVALRDGAPYLRPEFNAEARVNRDGFRTTAESAQKKLGEISLNLSKAHLYHDSKAVRELEAEYRTHHLTASGGTTCPAANRQGEITETARLILRLMPTG